MKNVHFVVGEPQWMKEIGFLLGTKMTEKNLDLYERIHLMMKNIWVLIRRLVVDEIFVNF